MHPALESHPQNAIFKRDFKGSSGLFSIQHKEEFSTRTVDAFCDNLKLFAMGYSWDGLEDVDDLIEDQEKALNVMHAASVA